MVVETLRRPKFPKGGQNIPTNQRVSIMLAFPKPAYTIISDMSLLNLIMNTSALIDPEV